MEKRIAVFLDRDGVVTEAILREYPGKGMQHGAPFSLAEFKIFPDVVRAVIRVRDMGMLSIVATNQPDVTYGNLTREDFDEMMRRTRVLGFDDIFVCEHGRDEGCLCKKPKPGILHDAEKKWNIDLSRSYIIGDTKSDIGAGKAAGCKTILIARPYNEADRATADVVAASLAEALDWVENDRAVLNA